jgi:hypothetical protein
VKTHPLRQCGLVVGVGAWLRTDDGRAHVSFFRKKNRRKKKCQVGILGIHVPDTLMLPPPGGALWMKLQSRHPFLYEEQVT